MSEDGLTRRSLLTGAAWLGAAAAHGSPAAGRTPGLPVGQQTFTEAEVAGLCGLEHHQLQTLATAVPGLQPTGDPPVYSRDQVELLARTVALPGPPADDALPAGQAWFSLQEVSRLAGVEPYVVRFWSSELRQLEPRSVGGARRYARAQVLLFLEVRRLVEQDLTMPGIRKRLAHRLV